MKLKVFEEAKTGELEVFLRIKDLGGNMLVIQAVDSSGEVFLRGNLIRFTPDGGICLNRAVNPNLGFKLDAKRRLCVQPE